MRYIAPFVFCFVYFILIYYISSCLLRCNDLVVIIIIFLFLFWAYYPYPFLGMSRSESSFVFLIFSNRGQYTAVLRYEISLRALKKYFTNERAERVKYFSTIEDKFRISKRPCHFLFVIQPPRNTTKDVVFFSFQKLRFELDYISLQSISCLFVSEAHKCLTAHEILRADWSKMISHKCR